VQRYTIVRAPERKYASLKNKFSPDSQIFIDYFS